MKFKSEYLQTRCSQVEEDLKKAARWASQDAALDGYLGGYFVVMVSGVFEDCIEHLVWERVNRTNDKELTSLVEELIDQFVRNPTPEKVATLVKYFSAEYLQEYRRRITDRHSLALGSIVTNKNHLGHGTLKRNVTVSDAADYFQNSTPILEALEEVLS